MQNQFMNYELTPTDYIPNNTTQENKVYQSPKLPHIAYNFAGNPIGYTWNYGDSIILEFKTSGNVVYENQDVLSSASDKYDGFTEDAETYLEGKKFQLLMYDSRYNLVAHCEADAAPTVRILSDNFYPSTVVPGVYRLKLILKDETNKDSTLRYTLLNGDEFLIYIK